MDRKCEAKKVLAWTIVRDLCGREAADAALDSWEAHGEVEPTDVAIEPGVRPLPRLLVELGLAPSTSEARRLIAQGALRMAGVLLTDVHTEVEPRPGTVVRVGKRRAATIRIGGVR